MSEQRHDSLEGRSRALFEGSVENLDMRIRSRLTQARHAALESAAARGPAWLPRRAWWMPAAGVTAAAVLGVALWIGSPPGPHAVSLADAQPSLEDLDIVAFSDGSGDAMEMLQDDLDFYDFADKAANTEPAA
jgi:hypothetical protein